MEDAGTMKSGEIDIKTLDKIVKDTMAAVEKSKERIYDIYEAARHEVEHVKNDLERVKQQAAEVIFTVDEVEKRERRARLRLMEVSRNFRVYSETDIKKAYDEAKNLQVELAVTREQEQNLRRQRDDLEVRLKNLKNTVNKAEELTTQVGAVLGYLGNQMDGVVNKIESMQYSQQFGAKIIKAQEEERRRVSREIHDGPAQAMANIVFRAEVCERLIDVDIERSKRELGVLREQVRICLRETRKIIFDLRPMTLDDLGLIPTVKRVLDNVQERCGVFGSVQVIGEERRLESYLEIGKFINLLSVFIDNYNLSLKYSIDKLTQAYNRQYFDIFIKNELESAQGQKSMFSLVIMDIDFFKSVNDTFGHGFGDITLKRFSKIVQGSIRSSDLFARYGGEEFVLVLKHTSAVEAYSIADRIREKMYNELKDLEGKPITVSMGISTYPEHGVWEEELINKADIALYKAKDSGRNKVCIWDNTLNNSEIFDRKKENIIASIFCENHQRSNLFVNSINLIKTSDGDTEVFDKYILDVLKYFEAEKLFIIKYEDSEIESLIKGTSQGTFVIKHGFENQINLNIVKTCYDEEKSLYLTDWEQVSKLDELTGMPEWDSVLSTPIIHKGKKKGVLYMCAPVRFKEFSIVDSSVAQIIAPIIGDFM